MSAPRVCDAWRRRELRCAEVGREATAEVKAAFPRRRWRGPVSRRWQRGRMRDLSKTRRGCTDWRGGSARPARDVQPELHSDVPTSAPPETSDLRSRSLKAAPSSSSAVCDHVGSVGADRYITLKLGLGRGTWSEHGTPCAVETVSPQLSTSETAITKVSSSGTA